VVRSVKNYRVLARRHRRWHSFTVESSRIFVSLDLLVEAGAAAIVLVAVTAYVWTRKRGQDESLPDDVQQATNGSSPELLVDLSAARAVAMDAISEAVLIVQSDGRVRDCNSAALALFQRHRASIQDAYVPALRALDDGGADVYAVARERGLWTGEGWVRLPDGSLALCTMRIVPLHDADGRVAGFAEAFRDVVNERLATRELRDRLFGVHRAQGESADRSRAEEALMRLGESFRDLELAVQHYESVVSALRLHDPATESVAGLVHESHDAGNGMSTQALLQEVPQLLARLRTRLSRLEKVSTR
jgi:PAS domain-containing protein